MQSERLTDAEPLTREQESVLRAGFSSEPEAFKGDPVASVMLGVLASLDEARRERDAALAAAAPAYRTFAGEKVEGYIVLSWRPNWGGTGQGRWVAFDPLSLSLGDTYIPQPPAPKEVR